MTEFTYAVGRGKPPLHTRFQKGQSGNPSGKPGPAKLAKQRFMRALCAALQGSPEELELFRPDNVIAAMARKISLDACNGRIAAVRLVLSRLDAESEKSSGAEDDAAEQLFTAAEIFSLLQGKAQGNEKLWLEQLLGPDADVIHTEANYDARKEQISEPVQTAPASARNETEPFSLVQGKTQGSCNKPWEQICPTQHANRKQPGPRAQLMTGAAHSPPPWAIASEFKPPAFAVARR